jgi:PhzF family phenazine biosynthesis protein
MKRGDVPPALLAQVAGALGLEPRQVLAAQSLDNGPVWLSLLVDDPHTVLRLAPDHARLKSLGQKVGVVARRASAAEGEPLLEVRAFAAAIGVPEDPVTGSLNASLAQWLIDGGQVPERYVAAQGTCLDRAGRVHVERDAQGQVWVGGACVTCIDGSVQL